MELYECPKCGHKYDYPETNPAELTFWNCPSCGAEDGMHVSPAIDIMLNQEQLAEIERKKNTYCSLKVIFTTISDVPKFKKFMPELNGVRNHEIIARFRSEGGIAHESISLLGAEQIKARAELFGLKV